MLRDFLYDILKADQVLGTLGYAGNLYGAAPDTPTGQRFMVMRWGNTGVPPQRDMPPRPRTLTVWAYNRERDYGPIEEALKRVCSILLPMEAVNHGSGWVSGVVDNGSSDDLFDPVYEAATRNWTYTIIASES
jgi:hypothetical protein